MSTVVFLNMNNTGGSWLLPLLQDLDTLRDYDWGAAAYSHRLYGLDDACRGSS